MTYINATMMELYIIPTESLESDDDEPQDEEYSLNFTWSIIEMQDDLLSFQLIFDNPYSISPFEIQDRLVIHFFQNAT